MLLKLVQVGNPILRKTAKPVSLSEINSKELNQIIKYMINTLRDAPGVGLAAPQVGINKQIIIIEDKAKYHEQVPKNILKLQKRKTIKLQVLINPKLEVIKSKQELWFEGCLSVEGYVAAVPRSDKVKVTALDKNAKLINITADGWYARILQHEIDHLKGKTYVSKMKPDSFMTIKNFSLNFRTSNQAKIKKEFA